MSLEVEDRPNFPGSRSKWTEKIEFIQPDLYDGIPVYRVMNRKGEIIDPANDPQVDYKIMIIIETNIHRIYNHIGLFRIPKQKYLKNKIFILKWSFL